MNVTVVVPNAMKGIFEGRRRLELGVPSHADVGDVLQTLLTLYPKLLQYLPDETRPQRQHLNVVFTGHARDIQRKKAPSPEGQVLYLFGSANVPPPLARHGGTGRG